jgi:hypothetical protein
MGFSERSFLNDRSSRNIPTGPGSRGGQWHDQEFRRAYFRTWRANHLEYRRREVERRAEAKRRVRLVRDRAWVDALLAQDEPGVGDE